MTLFGSNTTQTQDDALAEWRARGGQKQGWKRREFADQAEVAVEAGMSKDDVIAMLGTPDDSSDTDLVYLFDDDMFAHFYMLVVYLDADGRVLRAEQTDSRTYKGP
ncbi:MAG: hypothetical protein ACFB11_24320 [Paracoccaceae bacterium]